MFYCFILQKVLNFWICNENKLINGYLLELNLCCEVSNMFINQLFTLSKIISNDYVTGPMVK